MHAVAVPMKPAADGEILVFNCGVPSYLLKEVQLENDVGPAARFDGAERRRRDGNVLGQPDGGGSVRSGYQRPTRRPRGKTRAIRRRMHQQRRDQTAQYGETASHDYADAIAGHLARRHVDNVANDHRRNQAGKREDEVVHAQHPPALFRRTDFADHHDPAGKREWRQREGDRHHDDQQRAGME
jgi:hypothetical protein